MLIKALSSDYIPQWLDLAREMEPIFQGIMVNDTKFQNFMKRKIDEKEVFMVLDRRNPLVVMGIIAFSKKNNHIAWFGVFEKYRKKGVGSKLLECAIDQLDNTKEIEVITFRDNQPYALPAKNIYKKYGFKEIDKNMFHNNQPRCLMKRPPDLLKYKS